MKMRISFLFAFAASIFLFLMPSAVLAEDLDKLVSSLQQRYESVNSIEADFTQDAYSKTLKNSQISEGKVYFKKPGKMRWQYLKPIKDELVSNGKTIWLYQPDLGQVVERSTETTASAIATDFLTGVGNLRKDFDIKLAEDKSDSYRLSLTPKAPQPNIKKLFLEVDKSKTLVTKTIIVDNFGNETRVSFKNIKTNTSIKDSLFDFVPPKGTTVVKP